MGKLSMFAGQNNNLGNPPPTPPKPPKKKEHGVMYLK